MILVASEKHEYERLSGLVKADFLVTQDMQEQQMYEILKYVKT